MNPNNNPDFNVPILNPQNDYMIPQQYPPINQQPVNSNISFGQQPGYPTQFVSPPPYGQQQNYQQPMNPQQMGQNIQMQQAPIQNPDIRITLTQMNQIVQTKKPDFCIYFFGCNQEREYSIYQAQNGQIKEIPNTQFLQGKESSNFCCRWCVSTQCRPYTFEYINPMNQEKNQYFILEKECQLTCCCFNRPVVKAYLMDNGNKVYLGKIIYNFNCCDYTFDVVDKQDQKFNFIDGSCCQIGHLCKGYPFDVCQEFDMDNKIYSGSTFKTLKRGRGFFLNCLTDANRIGTTLPPNMTWEQKALILLGFQLVDFSTFTKTNVSKWC